MRYWWVNQNQTYHHEIDGGYLWSPKRNKGDRLNPFYETMREVAPGDIVLSFCNTRIAAIGVARSCAWENPKPEEFGEVGGYWENVGWRVAVKFTELNHRIRPKEHIGLLSPLLPPKYSPLTPDGNGLQSVYLAELPEPLAQVLLGLIGAEASAVTMMASAVPPIIHDNLDLWERRIEQAVANDIGIPDTVREAIVRARRGQGLFKDRVSSIETRCRITGVENPAHLIASHCKPWRDSSNAERLDGENGLLLTPSIDHLFDRGYISFEDKGRVIISPVAHPSSLARMGVRTDEPINVGAFSEGQRRYLNFHRESVLLKTARR